MPIDDSFLRREAAKRRMFTIIILALVANVVALGILYATGFLHRQPGLARVIIYSELVVLGAGYLVFKLKARKETRK